MSPNPMVWLMRSPGRLVLGLVAVGLAILGVLIALSAGPPPSPELSPGDRTGHRDARVALPATLPEGLEPSHPDGDFDERARVVLNRFLELYTAPTTSENVAELEPLSTADLWHGLSVATVENLPAGPVKDVAVKAESPFSMVFAVTLVDTDLLVDVVQDPQGVRVAAVEPVKP